MVQSGTKGPDEIVTKRRQTRLLLDNFRLVPVVRIF